MRLLRRHRRGPEPIPMTSDEIRATTVVVARLGAASDQMDVALGRVREELERRWQALEQDTGGLHGGRD